MALYQSSRRPTPSALSKNVYHNYFLVSRLMCVSSCSLMAVNFAGVAYISSLDAHIRVKFSHNLKTVTKGSFEF